MLVCKWIFKSVMNDWVREEFYHGIFNFSVNLIILWLFSVLKEVLWFVQYLCEFVCYVFFCCYWVDVFFLFSFDVSPKGEEVVRGYDFLVNAVWPEIASSLEGRTPSIFAPGNPNTFHEVINFWLPDFFSLIIVLVTAIKLLW